MKFLKVILASFLGMLLFTAVVVSIFLIILFANKKEVKVSENSVLVMKLNRPIIERENANPLENIVLFPRTTKQGLNKILQSIQNAKADKRIKGIFLNLTDVQTGWASLKEIRNALLDFKSSGKFISAYGESFSEKAYYLATASDSIFLNPEGIFEFNGLSATLTFYKRTLDKLGVEAQVIRHGKFKSAIEPFTRENMSDENRLMIKTLVDDIYRDFLQTVSDARKISVDDLYKYADEMKILFPEDALQYGMVDKLAYEDEAKNHLRIKLKVSDKFSLHEISLEDYSRITPEEAGIKIESNDRIAVIYAIGEISSGKGSNESIGSETLAKAIRDARKDKNVKAIVLRVNSPGGSSLASDIIWREMMLTKNVKPLIVSMGDVAASGGYYISVAADTIVCETNTITSSIGVFGLLPNLQKLYNDKIGFTFDGVKTGKYADIGTTYRPLTDNEFKIAQRLVDKIYDDFVNKVAKSRRMTYTQVDSIAQGRVWSGEDALHLGLVDTLGNLNDAIKIAAGKAGLKEGKYKLKFYPAQKTFEQLLLEGFSAKISSWFNPNFEEEIKFVRVMNGLKDDKGIHALMPFEIKIK